MPAPDHVITLSREWVTKALVDSCTARCGAVDYLPEEDQAMSSEIFDENAPSLRGGFPRQPEDLPHGLITPPQEVRELVAKEKAKYSPEVFDATADERILNQWTLDYFFDYLGHEVIYRQTPDGPDVQAVGEEEIIRLQETLPLEEQLKLKTWLP
jgi:hypothetical protein